MSEEITIRLSRPEDHAAVLRLAALDSKAYDGGELVLAERGGELVAAVPVAGGAALADPFRPTAEVVALLELRAAQLHSAGEDASGGRGLRVRAGRRRARLARPSTATP